MHKDQNNKAQEQSKVALKDWNIRCNKRWPDEPEPVGIVHNISMSINVIQTVDNPCDSSAERLKQQTLMEEDFNSEMDSGNQEKISLKRRTRSSQLPVRPSKRSSFSRKNAIVEYISHDTLLNRGYTRKRRGHGRKTDHSTQQSNTSKGKSQTDIKSSSDATNHLLSIVKTSDDSKVSEETSKLKTYNDTDVPSTTVSGTVKTSDYTYVPSTTPLHGTEKTSDGNVVPSTTPLHGTRPLHGTEKTSDGTELPSRTPLHGTEQTSDGTVVPSTRPLHGTKKTSGGTVVPSTTPLPGTVNTPDVPDVPSTTPLPGTVNTPDVPDVPSTTPLPGTVNTPDVPSTRSLPVLVKTFDNPEVSEETSILGTVKTSDDSDIPSTGSLPGTVKTSDDSDIPSTISLPGTEKIDHGVCAPTHLPGMHKFCDDPELAAKRLKSRLQSSKSRNWHSAMKSCGNLKRRQNGDFLLVYVDHDTARMRYYGTGKLMDNFVNGHSLRDSERPPEIGNYNRIRY